MFIQTEPTPNPNVLKFLPGRDVAPQGVLEYRTIDEAAASPLAEALFELEGVEGVFFGADYVSVTRGVQAPDWSAMKAPILSVVMDHFVSGAPLTRGVETAAEDAGEDSEIVAAHAFRDRSGIWQRIHARYANGWRVTASRRKDGSWSSSWALKLATIKISGEAK